MKESILYYPSSINTTTAVTLVAHGLNVKPAAMWPLVNWLTNQGSAVYLVQLAGHHSNSIDINAVTLDIWQNEIVEGYRMARAAAVNTSLPFYFLGYSLGALLAHSIILPLHPKAFHKQVLLAPAIAIRPRSYLIKLLFLFGRGRRLPSFAPRAYRYNASLPLHIYHLMFNEAKKLVKGRFKNAHIPTLVVIDPKDELISYRKLKQQLKKYKLINYEVVTLQSRGKKKKGGYHHLILDEQTMGKENWEMATGKIQSFLFNNGDVPSIKTINDF